MRDSTSYSKKKGICGICPAGCWVEIGLKHGKIVSVDADPDSPYGAVCSLGKAAPEIIYSPDRLKTPLRRKGKKGNLSFQSISWDEAFDEIADRLIDLKDKYGPESAAIYTGRGSFDLAMCDVFQPAGVEISSASSLLFPFGSPNSLGVGALCYVSFAMIAPHVTMGGMYYRMFNDLDNADMVVVWGANPASGTPPYNLPKILRAKQRGAEIIVIDPIKTEMVDLADAQWISIRPGTDGALALGIANLLIREDLYDHDFVENWTHGFSEFKEYCRDFSLEKTEEITGIPKEVIRNLALDFFRAKGISPIMYTGLEYTNSGVQNIRATFAIWALLGMIDRPGSSCFSQRENLFPINKNSLLANPNPQKALAKDEFALYYHYRGESHAVALPRSVLEGDPYKIRALLVLGASLTTSWPQPEIWEKTLSELDFLVSIDRTLTADAKYADIVLPATTMFEIDSYMTYGPIFRLREKIINPIGESRSDFFIQAELAKRLGYGELFPQSVEEMYAHVLKGSGFSYEDVRQNGGQVKINTEPLHYEKWKSGRLRSDGQVGFDTPTAKFEFVSTKLEEFGYAGLPLYQDPVEGPREDPETAKKFPLVFNSGARVKSDFRSQHHNIPSLVKMQAEPRVLLHPRDAAVRNIQDGAQVILKSKRGELRLKAEVSERIRKGTVEASMGGGSPIAVKAWQRANINVLTDLKNYDPISGFPVYKALLCEVEKAVENDGEL